MERKGEKDEIEIGKYRENGGEKRKKDMRMTYIEHMMIHIWVGYDRIRINEQWWRWDKDKEVLRDKRGNRKEVISGERGKREERDKLKGGEGRMEGWKMVFWNVAELGNKDEDFWKGLGQWDVLMLSETWVEEFSFPSKVDEGEREVTKGI